MYIKLFPRLIFILVSLVMSFSACKAIEYAQRDPFYNNGSEWDHLRFPLIKPYYATWSTEEYGWVISLHVRPSDKDTYYYLSLRDVQKIAIENGVIMVFTPYEKQVRESVGQKVLYWFAIVPEQNIETGFETGVELLDYIQQYGIDKPDWREPDDILLEYDRTWCLDWIPGCE